MTTIDELNQKREQIAKYDQPTLEMMSVAALKKLASGIVPGHSKLKKDELIAGLISSTKAERVVIALIPDTPLEALEANKLVTREITDNVNEDLGLWTKKLYNDFRDVVQVHYKNGDWDEKIHGDIAALAYRVVRFLDTRDGEQNDGGLAFTTKLRYRTYICNLLSDLVRSEQGTVYYKQFESCLEMLLKQIRYQITDLTAQKKGLQERRLADRKPQKETINFQAIYDFAVTTLRNLDDLKPSDWKKVSIALAIVTGRRMAEIHLTSSSFEFVDKRTCNFTGQLKVKGSAEKYFSLNPSYPIPVLVNVWQVISAHEWLKTNNRTVSDTVVAANRYTKDLSEVMKLLKGKFSIEHKFFTYKGLRTIYAQVCNQVFNGNDPDNTLYLAQILGHGRGDLISGAGKVIEGAKLTDMLTPQSYNSDFVVINTDCVNFD